MRKSKLIFFSLTLLVSLLSCQNLTPTKEPTNTLVIPPTQAPPTATVNYPMEFGTSIGDPFTPELGNMGYDMQHYDIDIHIDPAQQEQLEAIVTGEAVSTQDDLIGISLDFIGYNIHQTTVNGEVVEFTREGDKLFLYFDSPMALDQPFTFSVEYDGPAALRQSPYVPFADSIGPFFPTERNMFIVSEPDGARFWLPCNDHPRDKATFRFEVTVPDDFSAAANGLLLSEEQVGDEKLFIWQHDYPMATYLATIAVGPYERLEGATPDGIILREYFFEENRAEAEEAMVITAEAIDYLSDMLGPYPFEAHGHATIDASGFALETQTMVMMASHMMQENVIVHELTHMWFGDWVSLDSWGEMWRNEGFATYFEWMWMAKDDLDAWEVEMDELTQSIAQNEDLEPLDALTPENLFGYEAYVKGAVVVHNLRKEIGDEAFFTGLQRYFKLYGGGVASDEQFIEVMEEAAGHSLQGFFQTWLSE